MEWTEDYESGLSDIDVQHRYLFELINRLKDLQDDISLPVNRPIIHELVRYAVCHFSCEEQLMFEYDYEATSKHVGEHTKLLLELRSYENREVIEPRQLILFMCNWFVAHTMLEDRALAAHVIQRRAQFLGLSVSEYATRIATEYRPSRIQLRVGDKSGATRAG